MSATSALVDSAGLDVVVPLKPLQELRYRGMDFTGVASVETVLGQRQSPCVAVWIESAPVSRAPSDQPATASVRCRLAADLETAAGLPAVLTLASRRLGDVVAIPLVYVGLDKSGENYVVNIQRGSKVESRAVMVGPTDGVRRVVTSGLTAGDVVVPATPQ